MAKAKPITILDPEEQDSNQTDSPEEQDIQSFVGTNPDPSSDDDIGEMVKAVSGYDPDASDEPGKPLTEIIDEEEKKRHGIDDNTFSDE